MTSLGERTIEAVTFDFWNTIAFEGGNGLFQPRADQWGTVLAGLGHDVAADRLADLHRQALVAYQHRWRANEQYTTVDATADIVGWLGLDLDDTATQALVDAFHDAGRQSDIILADGIERCLRTLHDAGIHLAVVCDVGLTPSTALRAYIDDAGLTELFDILVFSEDVGWYKPSDVPFRAALAPSDVQPESAAHVGDRRHTDIGGAQALGMVGVRYTGVFDDPDPGPEGDLVIAHHDELLAALGLSKTERR